MTSPPPDAANPFSVTGSNGLTVTWSGGQANGFIQLEGSATDYTYTNGADFVCSVPAGAGTFTIPPSVLFALPARNSGQLAFRPFVNPVSTPGSGLSVARLLAWYAYFTPLAFNKSWLFPAQTSIHSENLS